MSKVIIVEGLSCSGKTTIGKRIAQELGLPFFNKDTFKELMFDNIGWRDREWSQKLGAASYRIVYLIVEELVRNGGSLVVESNFRVEPDRENFLKLKEKYGFEVIEILCWTKGEILFKRFKRRAESEERHPGHVDADNLEEHRQRLMAGKAEALGIGRVIEVETTEWERVEMEKVIRCLKTGN